MYHPLKHHATPSDNVVRKIGRVQFSSDSNQLCRMGKPIKWQVFVHVVMFLFLCVCPRADINVFRMLVVDMASHEWRTEECEQFVRLYWNHPCLYNTMSKDYIDKIKGLLRLDATAQFVGVIHDALVLGHMLINQRIHTVHAVL